MGWWAAIRLLVAAAVGVSAASPASIAYDAAHSFAAAELRRYLYVSSNASFARLCEMCPGGACPGDAGGYQLVLASNASFVGEVVALSGAGRAAVDGAFRRLGRGSDDHALVTTSGGVGVVLGTTDVGVLYGVYSFVETYTRSRFRLHGDVLPDRSAAAAGLGDPPAPLAGLAALLARLPHDTVVFSAGRVRTRGLQPFHDFAQGPDPWNGADYERLFSQMAKMKLNFLGLHTYGGVLAEPNVWMGLESTFDPRTGAPLANGSYRGRRRR